VTVSQSNITEAGWTGVGYIITDPVTGSGAYKISTGKNGGYILGQWTAKMIMVEILMQATAVFFAKRTKAGKKEAALLGAIGLALLPIVGKILAIYALNLGVLASLHQKKKGAIYGCFMAGVKDTFQLYVDFFGGNIIGKVITKSADKATKFILKALKLYTSDSVTITDQNYQTCH